MFLNLSIHATCLMTKSLQLSATFPDGTAASRLLVFKRLFTAETGVLVLFWLLSPISPALVPLSGHWNVIVSVIILCMTVWRSAPFLSPNGSVSLIRISAVHQHETRIIGWALNHRLLWELWSAYSIVRLSSCPMSEAPKPLHHSLHPVTGSN